MLSTFCFCMFILLDMVDLLKNVTWLYNTEFGADDQIQVHAHIYLPCFVCFEIGSLKPKLVSNSI